MSYQEDAWNRLKKVVAESLEHHPEDRETFLREACGGDFELLEQARRLLRHDQNSDNLLAWAAVPSLPAEKPLVAGSLAGPYRIIEPLGEGGMGEVYRAERADGSFEQSVAIKVLRARGLATHFRDRFLAERQLLADLDHPNIARLLDGGNLEDGRPFLVMELVEGLPLDEYQQRHQLPPDELLQLVRTICSAVAHAHRLLIVHRDLKPGNILITSEGSPKLLDFGVSKHLGDIGRTPETRLAAPMTLEYASPEQLLGGTVTTSVDVYALGVILFELLTGERPFSDEQNRLEERSHPSRPSLRVARSAHLESRYRRALRRRLTGDLDAIILRALAPRTVDRYPSVEGLARDIDRHLQGLPLESRGDIWYRLGKALKRNRKPLFAVGLILSLSFALGLSSWRSAELERENLRISEESELVERLSNAMGAFVGDLFEGANATTLGKRNKALEALLDRGARLLEEGAFESEPQTRAYVQASIGQVYRQAGRLDEAETLLRGSLELRLNALAPDDPRIGLSFNALSNVQRARGRYIDGLGLAEEALRRWRAGYPGDDPDTASILSNLAGLEKELGLFEKSIRHFTQSLEMKQRLDLGPDTISRAHKNLATAQLAAGLLSEAEDTLAAARAQLETQDSWSKSVEAGLLHYLGILQREQGEFDSARVSLERSLELRGDYRETHHRQSLGTRLELAQLEVHADRLDEAEGWLSPVIDELRAHPDNPITLAEALRLAAEIERARGRYHVSGQFLQEALDLAQPLLPPRHHLTTGLERELAAVKSGK